jgi:hypothetical protein
MNVTGVTVEEVSTKEVNTKFGPKPTFSFKAGGQWYKTGFTRPAVKVGDTVDIEYTEGKYGKDVNAKGGIVVTGAGAAPVPAPRAAAPSGGGGYGSKGVFPIPALDGQRSIVRQNALTNAREALTAMLVASKRTALTEEELKVFVMAVIDVAKRFEAYTAGDMDMEAAKAAVDKELTAAKAAS